MSPLFRLVDGNTVHRHGIIPTHSGQIRYCNKPRNKPRNCKVCTNQPFVPCGLQMGHVSKLVEFMWFYLKVFMLMHVMSSRKVRQQIYLEFLSSFSDLGRPSFGFVFFLNIADLHWSLLLMYAVTVPQCPHHFYCLHNRRNYPRLPSHNAHTAPFKSCVWVTLLLMRQS